MARWFACLATALLVWGSADAASAQAGRAAVENIRNASLGAGYSISAQNQLDLMDQYATIPGDGVSSGDRAVSSGSLDAARPQARPRPRPATFGATTFGASTFGGGFGGSKPFANSRPTSTVSPYLNLFLEDSIFGDPNNVPYQTLVRPQLEQQQFNSQVQQQAIQLNRRVQALQRQPAFNPEGSEEQLPTGHSTVFNNMSHYYPTTGRR